MTYQVKLTKIKSTHNNLRTDVIEGKTFKLPEVGDSFAMFGEPLTEGFDTRAVYTTEIKVCDRQGNEFMFVTENSTYKLEVLETLEK
jgi:hypothetical protein